MTFEDLRSFHNQEPLPAQTGMTLRDYFAAKAMQAFVKISRDNYNHGNPNDGGFTWVAEMSYKQADAMLKARIK